MKKKIQVVLFVLLFLALTALLLLYIAKNKIAVLDPAGSIAHKQKDLLITASLLMLIVVIPVFVFMLVFSWKYGRKDGKATYTPNWEHSNVAEAFWWGIPFAIIVALAIITWKSSHELNPFAPIDSDKKPLKIQVVALEWKWLFLYPEQGIASVNFLQFPEKTPVAFDITADAPMNSFWIPRLGGQIYAMPAMRSKLHLIANEIGEFMGTSANLSGDGFAGMKFVAKASSKEDFDKWVASVKKSSKKLTTSEYQKLAEPSQYNPVAVYGFDHLDLFDEIIWKYETPQVTTGK